MPLGNQMMDDGEGTLKGLKWKILVIVYSMKEKGESLNLPAIKPGEPGEFCC